MILEEIYDVVDPKGKVIGKATWSECHTQGLLHQCVHGILFRDDSKSQTLIKKRSKKSFQGPNLYEIAVAGHILSGESPDEGIKRELEEELFGNKKIPKKLKIKKIASYFNNDIPGNHEIAYVYEIIYSGPVIREVESTSLVKWVDWSKLKRDININPKRYAQYTINTINEYLTKTGL